MTSPALEMVELDTSELFEVAEEEPVCICVSVCLFALLQCVSLSACVYTFSQALSCTHTAHKRTDMHTQRHAHITRTHNLRRSD